MPDKTTGGKKTHNTLLSVNAAKIFWEKKNVFWSSFFSVRKIETTI